MKLRLLASLALVLGLAAASPIVRAQDSDSEKKTDLEKQMSVINKATKKLKGQINDSTKNESSLAQVAQIKDAASQAATMKPAKEADLPADQQADFQAKYEQGMKDFIAQVDKLSDALTAGDNAQAAKIYQGLFGLERKDHKAFKKPKKD